MIDEGLFSESQIGFIGSALFVAYAIGKLTNGFFADRSNIRRFMSFGLLVSALINLMLGLTTAFYMFFILWGLNGWFQAMGAAPSVVALSRWFSDKERGSYYGAWCSSHSVGKAITFIATAFVVSMFGWRWGFVEAGLIGIVGATIVYLLLHDTPESDGLPPIADYHNDHAPVSSGGKSVSELQIEVLKNPYIWILALSSAMMYISRYAIESWGIFFLQTYKGYSVLKASSIISIGSITGIFGTLFCGYFSDKFFNGSRNVPNLLFGLINVTSLALFFFVPNGLVWLDTLSMALFGLAIGALVTFVGGLMAVDIASKKASGAALGLVGVASYIGAAIQDTVSGHLIEKGKVVINGEVSYNFTPVMIFWLSAAILSVVLALLVWNAKRED